MAIGFFYTGAAHEIIHAYTVKISKLYQSIHRIAQHTNFILGICILTNP